MFEILKSIKNKKMYAEFYGETSDRFNFGKIKFLSNTFVIIHLVTPDGLDDGYYLEKTKEIFDVKTTGEYIDNMEKLIKYHGYINDDIFDGDNPVISLLEYAKSNNLIVSVELLDSGIFDGVGFIEKVDNNLCKMKAVDFNGNEDGITYIKTDKITKISCGSEDERRAKILWEYKNRGEKNVREYTVSDKR